MPLVEVILRSPLPVTEKNSTVLATWTYGAGKSAALTTDAGQRWASQWTSWENYDKFFSQLVRWSMRPTDDTGNFSVATNTRDNSTQVIVTALDQNEEFLNDQLMTGTVVAPDMSSVPIRIEQTAPGRYTGEFPSEMAGSYLVVINPGAGQAPIRTGVNVGYSAEYRDHQTNMALLRSLAELAPEDAPQGVLLEGGLDSSLADLEFDDNPFRRDLPPAIANQSIWPWLMVLGSCIFLGDVFVRRVQVSFLWMVPLLARSRDYVMHRQRSAPAPETMSRLRSKKQEIGQQIERQRSAARFEAPTGPESTSGSTLDTGPARRSAGSVPKTPADNAPPETAPEESYTERLLKAKRQVWEDRGGGPEGPK
mgnify:CR=1 FL=1